MVVPADSDIKTAKDLIGKKIAVNTLGANSEAVLDTWFEQEGLTKAEQDQITLVVLPPLDTPVALEKGQVDAAVLMSIGYKRPQRSGRAPNRRHRRRGGRPLLRWRHSDARATSSSRTRRASEKLVDRVAKAVKLHRDARHQEIFDVLFPWLEEHGYEDYIEPIEANFPGTPGVAPERGHRRRGHRALARLAREPRRRRHRRHHGLGRLHQRVQPRA